jgi:hypothetical protein
VEKEAFRRMCSEHEYYSRARKRHLCSLLRGSEKKFKLVLRVRQQFEEYCGQVRKELGEREGNCPVDFNFFNVNQEELTAQSLHFPNH